MKRIRSGRGLGDTLYMQSVVRHLLTKGERLEVCTDYPEVFDGMPVNFAPFARHNINYLCHYTKRKTEKTNQWEDIYLTAGLKDVELKIDWKVKNKSLVEEVKNQSEGKKILFVHGGREPMARKDRFGRDLLPNGDVFNRTLRLLSDFFSVHVGDSELLYPVYADKSLNRQTSVSDLLDIAYISDAFYGQCSFIIPLAESFSKPLLVVWSNKGLHSGEPYIATITPRKILSKKTSTYIIDNWSDIQIKERINEFRGL